mgnify:CR=1 FL=1
MSRIGSTDYYAADVPEGYTQIVFSSYPLSNDDNLAGRGDSTGWETIPDYKDKEPCFYADTNDDAVYGKGQRAMANAAATGLQKIPRVMPKSGKILQ